jgi:hypothetical protein
MPLSLSAGHELACGLGLLTHAMRTASIAEAYLYGSWAVVLESGLVNRLPQDVDLLVRCDSGGEAPEFVRRAWRSRDDQIQVVTSDSAKINFSMPVRPDAY